MANETPDDAAEALSAPEKALPAKGLTSGLWSYPLLAIGIAMAGVIVAALLVWTAVVRPANVTHREQLYSSQAQSYAQFFNVRIANLRRQMGDAAAD